jgi:hypothetical protein
VVYGQDVVVRSLNTGYQSLPNERSAGSFAKPNEVLIRDRANSTNILQRLDGLVPGLTVSFAQGARPTGTNRTNTGEGNSNQFIIRGTGFFLGVQRSFCGGWLAFFRVFECTPIEGKNCERWTDASRPVILFNC